MPTRQTDAASGDQPLTKIRALMADDDPVERLRLSSLLARAGLEVIAVASGADVVNAVSAWDPNVIVINWPLLGGDIELIRELIEARGMGGRVILISSSADLRDQHAAVGVSAHYLPRPAEPESLIAMIQRAIEIR